MSVGRSVTPGEPVRSVPGGLAALVVSGGLVAFAGPLGAAAALSLVATWAVLGPVYAFAVGQIAVAALGTDWGLPALAAAQVALFAVLAAPDLGSRRGRGLALGSGAAAVLLGAATYGAQTAWESTWASAAVLVGTVAMVAYGLHRYELVATGGVVDEQ